MSMTRATAHPGQLVRLGASCQHHRNKNLNRGCPFVAASPTAAECSRKHTSLITITAPVSQDIHCPKISMSSPNRSETLASSLAWGYMPDKYYGETNFLVCSYLPKTPEFSSTCGSIWGDPHFVTYDGLKVRISHSKVEPEDHSQNSASYGLFAFHCFSSSTISKEQVNTSSASPWILDWNSRLVWESLAMRVYKQL